MRDISKARMNMLLSMWDIKPDALGYYDVGNGLCVYAGNAGKRRRNQVSYLIQQKQKHEAKNELSN